MSKNANVIHGEWVKAICCAIQIVKTGKQLPEKDMTDIWKYRRMKGIAEMQRNRFYDTIDAERVKLGIPIREKFKFFALYEKYARLPLDVTEKEIDERLEKILPLFPREAKLRKALEEHQVEIDSANPLTLAFVEGKVRLEDAVHYLVGIQ